MTHVPRIFFFISFLIFFNDLTRVLAVFFFKEKLKKIVLNFSLELEN